MKNALQEWPKWDQHRPLRPTDLSRTPSLAQHPRAVNLNIDSRENEIRIASTRLCVRIGLDPWSLTVEDSAGAVIVAETLILPNNPADAKLAMYGSLAFRLEIPERGLWRKYHHFRGRRLWFHATAVASWIATERGVEIIADTNDPF